MTISNTDPFGGLDAFASLPIDRAGLHILGRAACLALLGSAGVAALTVTRGALPVSLPVGYAIHDDSFIIRVSPHGVLGQTRDEVVAFCAYAADAVSHRGWSVSCTGMAVRVSDADRQVELHRTMQSIWSPGGLDDVFLALEPTQLSGRLMPG